MDSTSKPPPGTCISHHAANCHYTRLLLSRSLHKTFSLPHPQALTRTVPQEAEKPRLLLLLPSSLQDSQSNLPNPPVWCPVNSWDTLGISCSSIPQSMMEMGKENHILLSLLPPLPCPWAPKWCHTPLPKHAHPHPRVVPCHFCQRMRWEGRNHPLTSLPCLTPQRPGLSSPKLGSNTLSRYNF